MEVEYEYCITRLDIPLYVVPKVIEPESDEFGGWELVGFASADKSLYWTWRREI